jgi:hypothetical protein
MNKTQLARVAVIAEQIDALATELRELQEEAEAAYENTSDDFKESDAGDEAAEQLNSLGTAAGALETAYSELSVFVD